MQKKQLLHRQKHYIRTLYKTNRETWPSANSRTIMQKTTTSTE